MNYRERFQNSIAHKHVDRAPFDLHGTPMSMMTDERLINRLAELLGVNDSDKCEGVLKKLDIDFRRVGHMPHPYSPLEKVVSPTQHTDVWGIGYTYSGTDWQISYNPLRGAEIDDLGAFPWPQAATIDKKEIEAIRDRAKYLYEETDYVVSCEHPVFGVMELGCWMCGFDEFLLKLALEPEFVDAFCEKVWQYQKDVIDMYYGAVGDYIHLTTSGDDFGTQNGPFLSANMFGEMIAPWYDKRIKLSKEYTHAAFFHHTCGSVHKLIPRMLDSGVEILNPIQPGARDMEPERLKKDFGSRLSFWGGIDTQYILPSGTPKEVREYTDRVLDVFKNDGGYILAPAHNLLWDVPAENVCEMYMAAHDYYGV